MSHSYAEHGAIQTSCICGPSPDSMLVEMPAVIQTRTVCAPLVGMLAHSSLPDPATICIVTAVLHRLKDPSSFFCVPSVKFV
jgi:hypothetical protein